jgi:glycosyltransferase involved in cell wall biosynthesis
VIGHDVVVRVLHVVSRSQRRGAERAAIDLAHALDGIGCSNRIVALARGFDGSELNDLPALTATTELGWRSFLPQIAALRRVLRSDEIDIVLAHGGRAAEVAVGARRGRRPYLVWQRILGFPGSIARPPRRLWWNVVVRRIDGVVALDPTLEDEARNLGFRGTSCIIPNFRDTTRFEHLHAEHESDRLRAALSIAPHTPLIGFVGHLTAQKRPDRALAVIEEVHRLGETDAHLVVVGDGPLRADVEHTVRTNALNEYVHILGERDDVEQILAGIDVFVLTSDDEGIPGVLLEAALAGCCVVAPDIGRVASVVRNEETGLLTKRPDARVMAARVVELLRDPDRRRQMGANAREFAQRFSSAHAARAYFACFETVAQESASRASGKR